MSAKLFITDAQLHVWGADTPQRPWPANHTTPQRTYAVSPETLLFQMDLAGVDRAVLVPPSWEGDRNDLALDAAARYPDRFAIMGRIDVNDPASRGLLAGWRKQKGMLGLRFTFHGATGPQRFAETQWVWAEAEKQGVPITLLPPGFLPQVGEIAARHPGLRLSIDHAALSTSNEFDPAAHLTALCALAKYPNVAVKASSLPLFSKQPYPFADIQPWIRRLFEAFGPKRTFFGTDLTHSKVPYTQCIDLFTSELPWLKGDDLAAVMGKSVCEWWGWELPNGV